MFATVVRCPGCRASLKITSRKLEGKQPCCPRCGEDFLVEFDSQRKRYHGVLFVAAVGNCDETVPLDGLTSAIAASRTDQGRDREYLAASRTNTVQYQEQAGGRWRTHSAGAAPAGRRQRSAGKRSARSSLDM